MDKPAVKTLYRSRWSEVQRLRFEHLAPARALAEILAIVSEHFPGADVCVIRRAYHLALRRHSAGVQASSGRPLLRHLLAVAWTTATLGFDAEAVAAALLHDSIEERGASFQELRQRFGGRLAGLVLSVSMEQRRTAAADGELQRAAFRQQVERLLRYGLEELPAVGIRFAERLDHLQFSVPFLPHPQRADLCRETMQCYAPLAERLGIWELKALFEDLAFRHQLPDDYARIAGELESRRLWIDLFLHEMLPTLGLALQQAGLDARVQARIGHIYSTFEKMQRKGKPLPDIHDLMGARVIVETPSACYGALAVVHGLWKHMPAEFDDYIAHPKPNGYQSLHTILISPWGFPCEVQVRTEAMHQVAEYGVCAHWCHKGSGDAGDQALNELLCGVQRQLESIRRARQVAEHLRARKRSANQKRV